MSTYVNYDLVASYKRRFQHFLAMLAVTTLVATALIVLHAPEGVIGAFLGPCMVFSVFTILSYAAYRRARKGTNIESPLNSMEQL